MKRFGKYTDDELVQLYAQGCNQAFDTLLERHDAFVHTYIRFSITDEDLVEDIFQEAFIKVMYTIRKGKYTADGKFRQWLSRITHNLIMDSFRRKKVEARFEPVGTEEDGPSPWQYLSDATPNAEEQMIHCDNIQDLEHGLSTLPEEQRLVVQMRYWEEMSFKEIAEATGVSINTALGRMRYALINLRKSVR